MAFYEFVRELDISPARKLLEKAKVSEHNCGGSPHAGRAMDVDFEALSIDHVVQKTSSFEQTSSQVLFVEIVDWVVNGLYSSLLVKLKHLGPVDASVVYVNAGLDIQNSCHASFPHSLGVFLKLGVRAQKYIGVPDFIKRQASYEVRVGHFNVPVYDEGFFDVGPDIRLGFSQLAGVLVG